MINQTIIDELKSINIFAASEILGLREKLNLGDDNLGNCITGHASEKQKCFSIKPDGSMFKCFHCGCSGDVIKLVELSQSIPFNEACLWLADKFSPQLKDEILEAMVEPDSEKRRIALKDQIYREVFREAKECLHSPAGGHGLKYLTDVRGYAQEVLSKAEFGYIADDSIIRKTLSERYAGFPDSSDRLKMLKDMHIMTDRESPSIVLPVANRYGKITGLMKRHIPSNDSESKDSRWGCTVDLEKSDPLFLYKCKSRETVTLVEGYFDAVYMQALGIDSIALGQAVFTDNHAKGLKERNISRVIISLDNDHPGTDGKCTGLENTAAAVNTCIKAGLEPFVIDPRKLNSNVEPGGHIKDPDEYFRAYGAEALKQFLTSATEPGIPWLTKRLAEKHSIADPVQKSIFFGACRDVFMNIPKDMPRFKGDLLNEVSAITSINKDDIHVEFEAQLATRQKKDTEIALLKALNNGMKHKNLRVILHDLSAVSKLTVDSHNLTIPEFDFDAVLSKALSGNIEGLKIGLDCFDGTDDTPRYRLKQGGITIVAGDSGVGKTTLMLNMLLNMIRIYPEKTFVFITYEEAAQALLFKLININAGVNLNKGTNLQAITQHLRNTNRDSWNNGLQTAIETLRNYAQSKRLWLINENYETVKLAEVITKLCAGNTVGGIFVDYIQKIPSNGKFDSQQLRLQNLSNTIRATTQNLGCAVILGSQLNKDGQTREAMDIYQDANLVIKIARTSLNDLFYEAGIGKIPEKKTGDTVFDDGYRTLTIDKGRDVESGGKMVLKFNGPLLRLESLSTEEQSSKFL